MNIIVSLHRTYFLNYLFSKIFKGWQNFKDTERHYEDIERRTIIYVGIKELQITTCMINWKGQKTHHVKNTKNTKKYKQTMTLHVTWEYSKCPPFFNGISPWVPQLIMEQAEISILQFFCWWYCSLYFNKCNFNQYWFIEYGFEPTSQRPKILYLVAHN